MVVSFLSIRAQNAKANTVDGVRDSLTRRRRERRVRGHQRQSLATNWQVDGRNGLVPAPSRRASSGHHHHHQPMAPPFAPPFVGLLFGPPSIRLLPSIVLLSQLILFYLPLAFGPSFSFVFRSPLLIRLSVYASSFPSPSSLLLLLVFRLLLSFVFSLVCCLMINVREAPIEKKRKTSISQKNLVILPTLSFFVHLFHPSPPPTFSVLVS